jgi:endo-1,4-beta-mannosidase
MPPTNGKATDVDLTKMEDFVTKLAALRAQSFTPTTNAAGLADAALVAEASYDGDKSERVRFIRVDKEVRAVRDGEPGVAVVDADSFDETMKALDALVAPAS